MGNFNLINKLFGSKEFKFENTVQIKNNLKIHRILDTLLYEDKLFISYVNLENKCKTFKIAFAKFNIKYFKKLLIENNIETIPTNFEDTHIISIFIGNNRKAT